MQIYQNKKRKKQLIVLGILLGVLLCTGIYGVHTSKYTDAYSVDFSAANTSGFGSSSNSVVQNVYGSLVASDGNIYIATRNFSGAQLYYSDTGTTADWAAVTTNGFGDTANSSMALVEFDGYIYAGTENIDGAEVWRCQLSGNCTISGNWSAVVADGVDGNGTGTDENGFGAGSDTAAVGSAYATDTELYLGTRGNGSIWKTVDGVTWTASTDDGFGTSDTSQYHVQALIASNTHLYAGLFAGGTATLPGAQVWSCPFTLDCDETSDWSRITDVGFGTSGFTQIRGVNDLALFDGDIYAATDEPGFGFGTGGEIWRCEDEVSGCTSQSDWASVATGGISDTNYPYVYRLLARGTHLYATAGALSGATGSSVYVTTDGDTYTELVSDGFGDSENQELWGLFVFDNSLFANVGNAIAGLSLYSSDLDPSVSIVLGTPEQDGSGDVDLSVTFLDPDETQVGQMRVDYSVDGGAFQKATLSTTSSETTGGNANPVVDNTAFYQVGTSGAPIQVSGGTEILSTVWESAVDLADTESDNVRIRITPYDGTAEGPAATSSVFEIDNVSPSVTSVSVSPAAAKAGERITITVVSSELFGENPTVTVDGQTATFVSRSGKTYTYTYAIGGDESEGGISIRVQGEDAFANETDNTEEDVVEFDFTAPITTASPAAGTYDRKQDVILQATDTASSASILATGVDTIYYTTDGSTPTTDSAEYDGPISTAVSGTTTIQYFAVDNVGNAEQVKTAVYKVAQSDEDTGDTEDTEEDASSTTESDDSTDEGNEGIGGTPILRRGSGILGGVQANTDQDEEKSIASSIERTDERTREGKEEESQQVEKERIESEGTLQSIANRLQEIRTQLQPIAVPVAAVAVAGVAVSVVSASVGIVPYLRLLLQIITEPFRYFTGRRRRQWGVVYDVDTRYPLDLAIVRLKDADTGKLLQTSVTDTGGRYLFVAPHDGRYALEVTHPDYDFQGGIMHGKEDYLGGVFLVRGGVVVQGEQAEIIEGVNVQEMIQSSAQAGVILLDIPMRSKYGTFHLAGSKKSIRSELSSFASYQGASEVQRAKEDKRILSAATKRRTAHVISLIGPFLALVSFLIDPSWTTAILFVLHVVLLLLFQRLALKKDGDDWGRVFDLGTRKSLGGAIVRLFDAKYGKLLLAKVTRGNGEYAFLVGDGEYNLVASKEEYIFPKGQQPVTGSEEERVAQHLGMQQSKEKKNVSSPTGPMAQDTTGSRKDSPLGG